MTLIAGVDEAGRGPVIGPMIIAGVVVHEADIKILNGAGVVDSKMLPPTQRSRLAALITNYAIHIITVEVPPEMIDILNLNKIELDTFTLISSRFCRTWGERLHLLVVDSVGEPSRVEEPLSRVCTSARVLAKHHADRDYVVVAAASIIAKTRRDKVVEDLKKRYGDFGSGYPTDPRTINWIKAMYREKPDDPPPIVRRSWGLLKRIAPRWYREKRVDWTRQRTLMDYLG